MVWPSLQHFNLDQEYFRTEVRTDHPPLAKSKLEHMLKLDAFSRASEFRHTAIIASIGPSCSSIEMLSDMIRIGVDIIRVNAAYHTTDQMGEIFNNIREATKLCSQEAGHEMPIALMLELRGPEIMTGLIGTHKGFDEVELLKDSMIRLTTERAYYETGSHTMVFVDYYNITAVTPKGAIIFIDDGKIKLKVEVVVENLMLICRILTGGKLGSKKRVTLPGVPIDLPAVSETDMTIIHFAIKQQVDFLVPSRIFNEEHMGEVRQALGQKGKLIKVIGKIECQLALNHLDAIIEASDGMMFDRRKLSLELIPEKIPIIQKVMIAKCNKLGKPVICHGQLLTTMCTAMEPNKSDLSDAANCIIDGVDAVSLGVTTSTGQYPIETVIAFVKLCREAEHIVWYTHHYIDALSRATLPLERGLATCTSAVQSALHCSASLILTITSYGQTAQILSKFRPRCPIIAVIRLSSYAKKLQLYKGVIPVIYSEKQHADMATETDHRIMYGLNFAKSFGYIKYGEPAVVLSGMKIGPGSINTVRIIHCTNEHFRNLNASF